MKKGVRIVACCESCDFLIQGNGSRRFCRQSGDTEQDRKDKEAAHKFKMDNEVYLCHVCPAWQVLPFLADEFKKEEAGGAADGKGR